MPQCKFKSKIFVSIFAVLFTFLFTVNAVAQQGKFVETVDIQGNRRLTDKEILKHIKTRPGEPFNKAQIKEDVESLLKLDLFDKSQTGVITEAGIQRGVNVIFEVMELPLIAELKFNGLKYVTKEELLNELREQKTEVGVNAPYNPKKLRQAREIILEYLAKKRGFFDARVDAIIEEVFETTLNISFDINEMPDDDSEPENCCEN
jgi:outer membrane protein assembly factor BamA